MSQQHIFNRMPAEITVKIYQSFDDAGDIKAMLSTCKRSHEIFQEAEGVIARAHAFYFLNPSNYKCAVMAIASHDVDPADSSAVEKFLHTYIWKKTPWLADCFTMKMAAALPLFIIDVEDSVETLFEGHPSRRTIGFHGTKTEMARIVRTAFIMDTAVNLLYRKPGGRDAAIMWQAPHVEWVQKYWEAFSYGELKQVMEVASHFVDCIYMGTC